LIYEQILFGEKPDRIYMVDEDNPKQFSEYKFDKKRGYEFGKFFILKLY